MDMQRRPGGEALTHIFRPCTDDGEGLLHLWLGNTRKGKSYANNIMIEQMLIRKHTDVVLTVDEKNPDKIQYTAKTFRANVEDLLRNPLTPGEDSKHICFRGVAMRSNLADKVDHPQVARLAWDMKMTKPKMRVCLNIDELADATNGEQDWKKDENGEPVNGEIYRKGAGVNLSTSATTQLPQMLPRETYGLSQTIGMFQMDGRESSYLVRYKTISTEIQGVLEKLERGDFLLYVRGHGLMPHVYRF